MLLVASYYFYMNWNPAYALLIMCSTLTTWWCALRIETSEACQVRSRWLTLCLIINLAILLTFKYFNFAADTITSILHAIHLNMTVPNLDVLLPVGISFYTFQAIGYTIDVYRGSIKAERGLDTYALFVSFFPQLVAGPIERARNLLPQFHQCHRFDGEQFIEGLRLMVWGYFMKLCVAENVSSYVDAVYNNITMHNGTSIFVATLFFTFQIFCDFGGYSLIAIGVARCMGFTLMNNFNHPYLAHSVKDFWRRWHISLSTWFGEYVYIPLGGSRCREARHQRNLMLTMLLSGLWHGANWTFVAWGAYHGVMQCLYSLWTKYCAWSRVCNVITRFVAWATTFVVVMAGWVFFRANSLADAFEAFRRMFSSHGMLFNGEGKPALLMAVLMILVLVVKEVKDEWGLTRFNLMHNASTSVSIAGFVAVVAMILLCGNFNGGQFIYFQF